MLEVAVQCSTVFAPQKRIADNYRMQQSSQPGETMNIRARIKTKTIHQEGCIFRDVLNEQFSRMSGVYIQIGFACFLDIVVVPDYFMHKIANKKRRTTEKVFIFVKQ